LHEKECGQRVLPAHLWTCRTYGNPVLRSLGNCPHCIVFRDGRRTKNKKTRINHLEKSMAITPNSSLGHSPPLPGRNSGPLGLTKPCVPMSGIKGSGCS
jgi:hypothetical protein